MIYIKGLDLNQDDLYQRSACTDLLNSSGCIFLGTRSLFWRAFVSA
jgi:hypothetical protein